MHTLPASTGSVYQSPYRGGWVQVCTLISAVPPCAHTLTLLTGSFPSPCLGEAPGSTSPCPAGPGPSEFVGAPGLAPFTLGPGAGPSVDGGCAAGRGESSMSRAQGRRVKRQEDWNPRSTPVWHGLPPPQATGTLLSHSPPSHGQKTPEVGGRRRRREKADRDMV